MFPLLAIIYIKFDLISQVIITNPNPTPYLINLNSEFPANVLILLTIVLILLANAPILLANVLILLANALILLANVLILPANLPKPTSTPLQ